MAKALATKKVDGAREGSFPRGGGRLGWGRLARATELSPIVNRAFQRQKDLCGFIDDGLRREPNDVEATGLEDSCSARVLARLVSMDGAIDLDDEFECRAVEVDDESSDDVLTSKSTARRGNDKTVTKLRQRPPSLPSPASGEGANCKEIVSTRQARTPSPR